MATVCPVGTFLVLYKDGSSAPLKYQRVARGSKNLDKIMTSLDVDTMSPWVKAHWFIYEVGTTHKPILRKDLRKKYGLI